MGSKRHQHKAAATDTVEHRDVDVEELRAVLARARIAPLSAEDHALLTGAVDTLTALTRELQLKGVTLAREHQPASDGSGLRHRMKHEPSSTEQHLRVTDLATSAGHGPVASLT